MRDLSKPGSVDAEILQIAPLKCVIAEQYPETQLIATHQLVMELKCWFYVDPTGSRPAR